MDSAPAAKVPANNHDRQRHGNYLAALFGVLAGAVVFLPSILGILNPPFVWDPLLFLFWLTAILALVLLGLAVYFLRFTTSHGYPHRLSGLGSWLALIALACLVVYVAANGFQDRASLPHINSIKINPPSPRPGQTVELTADVTDEDEDRLSFIWSVNGSDIGEGEVAYWFVPRKPGEYALELRVHDGRAECLQRKKISIQVPKARLTMSKANALIKASMMRGLERVRQDDERGFHNLYRTYDAERLSELISGHFAPEDAEVYYEVIPRAFEAAVKELPEEQLQALLSGAKLPSCKDYPGLWPLCKK